MAQAKAAMILSAYGIDHKARQDVNLIEILSLSLFYFVWLGIAHRRSHSSPC